MGILFIISIGLFVLLSGGVLMYLTYDAFVLGKVGASCLLCLGTVLWFFVSIYWYVWFVSRIMEM